MHSTESNHASPCTTFPVFQSSELLSILLRDIPGAFFSAFVFGSDFFFSTGGLEIRNKCALKVKRRHWNANRKQKKRKLEILPIRPDSKHNFLLLYPDKKVNGGKKRGRLDGPLNLFFFFLSLFYVSVKLVLKNKIST